MIATSRVKNSNSKKGKVRKGFLICLSIGGVLAFMWGANHFVRRPEITAAMRGKQVAEELGCFACHGPEGFGGVPDPVSPAGKAPGWERGTATLYIQNEQEIQEWILHGKPLAVNENIEDFDPENLVPMPAYKDHLNKKELADLVAYFKAVSEYASVIPDEAYEGSVIANKLGCFGCHGPSGMGGMNNPGSFTGIIPSWDGEHYTELVENDTELREWILDGESKRLLKNPLGKFFLKRQVIQMPAYKAYLSEEELNNLMIYIKWLRGYEAKDKEADNPIA